LYVDKVTGTKVECAINRNGNFVIKRVGNIFLCFFFACVFPATYSSRNLCYNFFLSRKMIESRLNSSRRIVETIEKDINTLEHNVHTLDETLLSKTATNLDKLHKEMMETEALLLHEPAGKRQIWKK
jgi:septal ring factor EnvC (AmiA/AmiB activator)